MNVLSYLLPILFFLIYFLFLFIPRHLEFWCLATVVFKFTVSYNNVFRKKNKKNCYNKKTKTKKKLRKVSKYGVIPGPYFPVFGVTTEIYGVNLRIRYGCRKIWIKITPYLDTFRAVYGSGRVEFFLNDTSWLCDL